MSKQKRLVITPEEQLAKTGATPESSPASDAGAFVPDDWARYQGLSREELLQLIREQFSAGVRINFWGKAKAKQIARLVQPRLAHQVDELCVGPEEAQANNQIIEGENLQAMVTLYKLRGQVDLIVADPPYNTGKDFRYNDRWDGDPNDPDLGELVAADDPGRHTKWMKFMWPRLSLMRDMLKPGGVLAICIDQNELFRLGPMLDEIFRGNRLAIINWQKSYSPKSDSAHVSTATEYVLVYAKNEELATTALELRSAEMDARYSTPDGDRLWKGDNSSAPGAKTHPGMIYAIQSPFTGALHYPPEGRCWTFGKPTMKRLLEQWGSEYTTRSLNDDRPPALVLKGLKKDSERTLAEAKRRAEKIFEQGPWPQLYFGLSGRTGPAVKRYLEEVKQGKVPMTYWADEDYGDPQILGSTSWDHEESGHSQSGITELAAIVGKGHGFETVKPLKLMMKIIQLWCPPSGLVVDPFAGSGTTGHAVLELNAQSDTNRRFVMIEQGRPERGDPYARSLTVDRLRRVISGDWANGKGQPLADGFRFVSLQQAIDAGALLALERDDMVDAVVGSQFSSSPRGGGLVRITDEGYRYLVARNTEDEGFFLIWEGKDVAPVLDEAAYEAIADEARTAGLKPIYHVYARKEHYGADNVRFYRIPNRILLDFGLSEMTGALNSRAEAPNA